MYFDLCFTVSFNFCSGNIFNVVVGTKIRFMTILILKDHRKNILEKKILYYKLWLILYSATSRPSRNLFSLALFVLFVFAWSSVNLCTVKGSKICNGTLWLHFQNFSSKTHMCIFSGFYCSVFDITGIYPQKQNVLWKTSNEYYFIIVRSNSIVLWIFLSLYSFRKNIQIFAP